MEGLVKKIKGIRNEMIGLSIVLMLAGIFMILFPNTSGNIICAVWVRFFVSGVWFVWLRILEIMRFLVHSDWFRALHWQALDCIF